VVDEVLKGTLVDLDDGARGYRSISSGEATIAIGDVLTTCAPDRCARTSSSTLLSALHHPESAARRRRLPSGNRLSPEV
jgi:hypothetical protein